MFEDLHTVVNREEKRLALELQLTRIGEQPQQLGTTDARSDRRRVGSGGAVRERCHRSQWSRGKSSHGEILERYWG